MDRSDGQRERAETETEVKKSKSQALIWFSGSRLGAEGPAHPEPPKEPEKRGRFCGSGRFKGRTVRRGRRGYRAEDRQSIKSCTNRRYPGSAIHRLHRSEVQRSNVCPSAGQTQSPQTTHVGVPKDHRRRRRFCRPLVELKELICRLKQQMVPVHFSFAKSKKFGRNYCTDARFPTPPPPFPTLEPLFLFLFLSLSCALLSPPSSPPLRFSGGERSRGVLALPRARGGIRA